MNHERQVVRQLVRGVYQLQKTRIITGNRVCAAFRSKMGLAPSQKEGEADKEALKILKEVRSCFERLTDGLVMLPSHRKFFPPEGSIIDKYTELVLVNSYMELLKNEEDQFKRLDSILMDFPVYANYFKGVKGVGPAMAGVLISEVDITKVTYASSLWKYAGLDVVINDDGFGEGRSRKSHHLVDREYTDKNGVIQLKKGITFNPFLKTKLMGVQTGCFIKCASPYAEMYRNYKFRLQNMPEHAEKSDNWRHWMAMRYMIKMYLIDVYVNWRTVEGLPVYPPYHEAKLGIYHRKAA